LMSSNPLTESRFEAQSKKIETILVLEGKKRKIPNLPNLTGGLSPPNLTCLSSLDPRSYPIKVCSFIP
jgi:hypothetical protein